jgi:hypothetical protein
MLDPDPDEMNADLQPCLRVRIWNTDGNEYSRYLKPTFDQIERGDGGVGDAARQHAAQGAEGVELGWPELAAVFLGGGSGWQLPGGDQLTAAHLLRLRNTISRKI